MNAKTRWAAWNWFPPARSKRLKRRQLGFALYDAARRPGLPPQTANAHARFELDARAALRDWLLL
jgi:hypothetical protein